MATTKKFIAFQIDGDKELAEFFQELPKSITDQVLRTTAKKALQPVADYAKATVLRHDGDLAESIAVSTRLSPRQRRLYAKRGDVAAHAGPTNPHGAHGHLVEFGTASRYHKSGKYVGFMRPHPFLRPAWDAMSGTVLATMRTEIWTVLRAAVRRLSKRAEKGTISRRQAAFFQD